MTGSVLDTIDGALRDWETSPDAMRWNPVLSGDRASTEQGLIIDISGIVQAMEIASAAVAAFAATMAEALKPFAWLGRTLAHDRHMAQHPREHIRCHVCHQQANPLRLCIDGHAYARRRKARARRKR